jgi:hypothetical protein
MNKHNSPGENAGKRLHSFMTRAQGSSGGTVRTVFGILFTGSQQSESATIFEGLVRMSLLADEIADLLMRQGRGDTFDAYMEHLPAIKRFFAVDSFDVGWDAYKAAKLRDIDVAAVKFAGTILPGCELVNEKELEDLRKQIDELYTDTAAANIADDLKRVVLDSIQKAKQAIHQYQLWGADGLRAALVNLTGTMVVHRSSIIREMVKEESQNAESAGKKDSIFKRLLQFAQTLSALVKAKDDIVKLAEWVGREGHHLLK